jgi:cell division protein FtsW
MELNSMLSLNRCELILLTIVSLLFINGFLVISLAYNTANQNVWLIICALIVCWFIIHFVVRQKIRHGDPFLLPIAIYLCSIGLIMIYRLKPEAFFSQSLWVVFGLIAFLLTVMLFHKFEDYRPAQNQ